MTTTIAAKLVSNEEWIEGLKSGKLKQAKSLVNKKERGVCAIAVLAIISGFLEIDDNFGISNYAQDEFNDQLFSEEGFNGRFPSSWVARIMFLNDDWGYSFEEIAEYIPTDDAGPYDLSKLPNGPKG